MSSRILPAPSAVPKPQGSTRGRVLEAYGRLRAIHREVTGQPHSELPKAIRQHLAATFGFDGFLCEGEDGGDGNLDKDKVASYRRAIRFILQFIVGFVGERSVAGLVARLNAEDSALADQPSLRETT